jgi:NitT/TauT family transport system substrate-binding protein
MPAISYRAPSDEVSEMRLPIALALVVTVAACSSSPAATPAPPSGSSAAPAPAGAAAAPAAPASAAPPRLEKVRVAYATVTAEFATPWMAKDAGLFEKYGLDADLQFVASGPTMLQSLIAGEADFGEVSAPSPMPAHVEGADVVWVTNSLNRPQLLIIATRDITKLEDLRGKSIGVTRVGTLTHTFMQLALRSAGLDPNQDVQTFQVGGQPETVAGLLGGSFSAGLLSPPQHQQAVEGGMHVLADLAQLGIAWPMAGSITTRKYIADNPDRVRSYVKAYVEALQLLRTDRERSVSLLMKWAKLDDRAIAEQAWESLRDQWVMPPYPDLAGMETVIREVLVPSSPRAQEIPPQSYYDDRFVRELVDSGFIRQVEGR